MAAESTTDIEGMVVNGTLNTNVPQISVHLIAIKGTTEKIIATVQTDNQGNFAFTGVTVDSSTVLLPQVTYQGVNYSGSPIRLSTNSSPIHSKITIYNSTKKRPPLSLSVVTLVFGGFQQSTQHISFLLLLKLHNPTNKTFIPTQPSNGQVKNIVLLPLPLGVDDVGLQSGLDINQVIQVNGGIASITPIVPGNTTISYSFRIHYHNSNVDIPLHFIYPISTTQILYSPSQVKVSASGFHPDTTLILNGKRFDVLLKSTLPPDSTISVHLAGLPKSTSLQRVAFFIRKHVQVIAGILIAIAAALTPVIYVFLRSHRQEDGSPNAVDTLIARIAELDDAYELETIDRASYTRERERLMTLLRRRYRSG